MKALKYLIPALVLTFVAAGCILVSGQFLVSFDLSSISVTNISTFVKEDIDLSTESDYQDHKDDLKAIADIAVLGKFTNNGVSDVGVEVYMTPDATNLLDVPSIQSTAVKLWGPFNVKAGQTVTVDWNDSAKLFSTAGKATLLNEAKGDGQFTLYAIGNTGTYNISISNGVLAITLDFGK